MNVVQSLGIGFTSHIKQVFRTTLTRLRWDTDHERDEPTNWIQSMTPEELDEFLKLTEQVDRATETQALSQQPISPTVFERADFGRFVENHLVPRRR